MRSMSLRCFLMFVVLPVLGSRFVLAQGLVTMVDTKIIPQIAAGDDWRTVIKILNQSDEQNTISLVFRDKSGQPLSIVSGNQDHLDFTLDGHKDKEIILDRRPGLQTGWARVTSTNLV
mgnify:CR=1 FL=1